LLFRQIQFNKLIKFSGLLRLDSNKINLDNLFIVCYIISDIIGMYIDNSRKEKEVKGMKKRVVMILLVALMVLPGCAEGEYKATIEQQEGQIRNLQDRIGILQGQVSDLESALDTEKTRNQDLQELIDQQQKEEQESETAKAKLEISFFPNPVICKDGDFLWKVVLTEVNGVGVELDRLDYIYYDNNLGCIDKETFYDSDIMYLFNLNNPYLPPYFRRNSGFGFPCRQSTINVDYAIFTIAGIDENGNEIEASGRVDISH